MDLICVSKVVFSVYGRNKLVNLYKDMLANTNL